MPLQTTHSTCQTFHPTLSKRLWHLTHFNGGNSIGWSVFLSVGLLVSFSRSVLGANHFDVSASTAIASPSSFNSTLTPSRLTLPTNDILVAFLFLAEVPSEFLMEPIAMPILSWSIHTLTV
jgi:hypothetical protein